jgi:hypothetical protein
MRRARYLMWRSAQLTKHFPQHREIEDLLNIHIASAV